MRPRSKSGQPHSTSAPLRSRTTAAAEGGSGGLVAGATRTANRTTGRKPEGAGISGPMAAMTETGSTWSALPLDLAGLVLRLLPAYADRARFATVCPQWRAAARQQLRPPPLPLLALPDGTFYSLPYGEPFSFPGCGFAGYKSACGNWLVFPRDDGCFLADPFSRATVTLPALSRVRLHPPNTVVTPPDPYCTWMNISDWETLHIIKLIVCSPNLVAALVGVSPICQILMCRPGALSWSVRADHKCNDFEDIAFYQGRLYAITDKEDLLVVNISEDIALGIHRFLRLEGSSREREILAGTFLKKTLGFTGTCIWLNRVAHC
ncbi:unnamed protein product [Alopecurus aequalis]